MPLVLIVAQAAIKEVRNRQYPGTNLSNVHFPAQSGQFSTRHSMSSTVFPA
jgi:hypothetical protein